MLGWRITHRGKSQTRLQVHIQISFQGQKVPLYFVALQITDSPTSTSSYSVSILYRVSFPILEGFFKEGCKKEAFSNVKDPSPLAYKLLNLLPPGGQFCPIISKTTWQMSARCKEGEHLDGLTRHCIPCRMLCQQSHVIPRCASYCESALCTAKPGHYFDRLVKKCVRCAEICGRHPAECSQHCSTTPHPVPTKRLPAKVTLEVLNNGGPPGLADSTIQLYSLLAVCIGLLLFSLSLASVVFLRGGKPRSSSTKPPKASNHKQKCTVQSGQELGFPGSQTGRSSKDFQTGPNYPNCREPSDDSSPVETCVCVHCFPDLRVLSPDTNRTQRMPYSFYQQPVLHRAHFQNGGSIWTEENLAHPQTEVQEEAALG